MSDFLKGIFIDPKSLPETGGGFVQVLFLGAVYGYVLFHSSSLISDGSELLLLVPSIAGVVGSIVLPVLGAVPDGAIVLFSGMGPDAQNQLSVGVGALAGSTIMLLTIPWALGIYAGRVDLLGKDLDRGNYAKPKDAKSTWKKLTKPLGWLDTGVVVTSEIAANAKVMVGTSLIYLIIQLPALGFTGTTLEDQGIDRVRVARAIHPYALAALVASVVLFVGYMAKNLFVKSDVEELKREKVIIDALKSNELSLLGALKDEILFMDQLHHANHLSYNTMPAPEKLELIARMSGILKPFYKKYDNNGDGTMDPTEFRLLFTDFNENISHEALEREFHTADTNGSGFIEFHEFVVAVINLLQRKAAAGDLARLAPEGRTTPTARDAAADDDDDGNIQVDDEEEEEEVPSDLLHLTVDEQQRRIKIRAATMMAVGTAVVLLFSDPMVDVLSEIGARTGVPPFYVSFVLAPLASNASELIASYNYAAKKTSKTITISLSALLGAACMNNTFCLGIFMALIYFQTNLVWEFSAETAVILFVQLAMGAVALRSTQRLVDAACVLSLYPLSLVLVYVLENVVGLD
ncbi:Aste57867_24822 [Aphanomyces stellatus]|uniref:Aste57867_24822 protein n=1 Tax=Aphanomyces stellatus TaxID=120398 RepID=A0A485LVQ9_9STRA|nr:hypothetical protein As57867_024744 [Aphanomyces stellatus]VFU01457.1 Aste57867_24822 [Aphanomyces stellatus]